MKGNEFRVIREKLELTQDQLARVLCLSSKQAVSNIETGFRRPSKLIAVLMRYFDEISSERFKETQNRLLDLSIHYDKQSKRKKP